MSTNSPVNTRSGHSLSKVHKMTSMASTLTGGGDDPSSVGGLTAGYDTVYAFPERQAGGTIWKTES